MKAKWSKRLFIFLMCVLCLGTACGTEKQEETVRIGAMKGPTTMGLLKLMEDNENGELRNNYEVTMAVNAQELLPLMIKKELDIALVPANVAAVLYQKTEGEISVLNINTLGVLYLVSKTASVNDISDLSGKTVYLTGKAAVPDYAMQYLLRANGVTDCTLEYKSEPTEVAALLAAEPDAIGLLPQPFVSAALKQQEELRIILSLEDAWRSVTNSDAGLVTGVTVVRKEFLNEHPEAVKQFREDHENSILWVSSHPDEGAAWTVKAGITANEQVAKEAIPMCHLTCIQGEKMKQALSFYLETLYEMDASFVGGAMPEEDFYLAD